MKKSSWDPLDIGKKQEIYILTIKRQIKNIIKSYTGLYDPLSELIQNALDAVDNRKLSDENIFIPTIWIEINLKENMVCVTDNGIGFDEDQFQKFLAPNVSFKSGSTRGNKGVGATYLAYAFNFIQLGTKNKDYQYVGNLINARKWLEDDKDIEFRPKIKPVKTANVIHKIFNNINRGSTFCLKFSDENYIRPKNLAWFGANTAEQWEYILRIKTPLGGIYFNGIYEKPICNLIVISESGESTEKQIKDCEYIFPHKQIPYCEDLKNIQNKQLELVKKKANVSKLPENFYNLNGIYGFWNYEDILSDEFKNMLDDDEKDLIEKHKFYFYGFLCYSTDIWDKFNDEIAHLRKKLRILKGGIQLATNNMPQGELIVIPLTKNIGFQNVTHIVIHIANADPDLGRKGFQPELVELAQKVSVRITNNFIKNWKEFLKSETGEPPDIREKSELHNWIREQEDHERNHPIVITAKDVFLPIKEPSITSEPKHEQDVVALFNQLIAGGVIRGLKLMSSSQHNQYDGIIRIRLTEPAVNHIFDKSKNPLGVEALNATVFASSPFVLEYKYSLDGLIEEIEKGIKKEKEIGIVVAWEMGIKWKERFIVVPLLYLGNLQNRSFHGGTHLFKNSRTGENIFHAVILSELISYINNVDGVQEYQKNTYIDDIY